MSLPMPKNPPAAADAPSVPKAMKGSLFAVVILTGMNLLNYLDRYVPSAVKPLFQKDLGLTDAQTAWPLTAFIVVYMLTSPLFGAMADRFPRKGLVAAGVALWSLATAAAAFAWGFWSFLIARALVGVGEAAYATLSPSLIADYYPPERRNRILTFFYVAIPVGAALGFVLGGVLGAAHGWRTAFLICGLPGVALALLVLLIKEPPRGQFDEKPQLPVPDWKQALSVLRRTPVFVWTVAGYTAVTFASGALADWFPTFLSRHRGFELAEAGSLVGTTAVVGGLGGTLLGGLAADWLKGRTRQPYLALSAGSIALCAVFAVLTLMATTKLAITVCMFAAQLFLWFYNGPVNALIVNSVASQLRARAVSISILSIHLFGDAISPPIVGMIADETGSLPMGIALVPVALAVGALVWARAWRTLPEPPGAA